MKPSQEQMAVEGGNWVVPQPNSAHEVRMRDDSLVVIRRHGNPAGPRLVLSHGNGFAVDLYYPFWSLFLEDFDVIVYDLRNHGWNPVGDVKYHNLPTFAQDLELILDAVDLHFGSKPRVGIYHSLTALVAVQPHIRPNLFSGLVLFDPPICKGGRGYAEFEAAAIRNAGLTRMRANKFPTKAHLAEIIPYLPSFQWVLPGVFELLAETTLRESADHDGYELCCPPEYEARILEFAGSFAVLADFDHIRCPVKVLGADPTLPYSYLPTFDLSYIIKVDYDFLPESTHLLQLEKPAQCAKVVVEFLRKYNLLKP
ncbi:MAG: alpha/beta hydrolase [Bacteroidota bacterium]|nr:alpha/beta hydrolase [Bacteroidota bacterium]